MYRKVIQGETKLKAATDEREQIQGNHGRGSRQITRLLEQNAMNLRRISKRPSISQATTTTDQDPSPSLARTPTAPVNCLSRRTRSPESDLASSRHTMPLKQRIHWPPSAGS